MRAVTVTLGVVLAVYLAICAALFFLQRSLLYFPVPAQFATAQNTRTLIVPGARLQISYAEHAGPEAVLYFGGNGEDVSAGRADLVKAFPDRAVDLLHYRGYGGSEGAPTQASLFADALALYDAVRPAHPSITLVGRSLGTGIAVYVASQRPVSRVVLVTPYDSLLEIAQGRYPVIPVRWLMLDRYESWRYAAAVQAPVVMLVAADDEIIPAASSRKLFARFAAGRASYHEVADVGHNSISSSPDYPRLLRGPP